VGSGRSGRLLHLLSHTQSVPGAVGAIAFYISNFQGKVIGLHCHAKEKIETELSLGAGKNTLFETILEKVRYRRPVAFSQRVGGSPFRGRGRKRAI